ncbi:hypothetical protein [Aliarcobacter butzleri]|uniref:hypothetical protein n=1 Tax=Aliarcobacter butzleri TaxID=28197 RepID=UPI002B255BC5|nr:hypothetical protein [Aliarcobacter butzleri]
MIEKYIQLLNEYFTEEELQEFLKTGKIKKQELIKDINCVNLENLLDNLNKEQIVIKDSLLDKAKEKASNLGLNINNYLEHLIMLKC